jgi:hypothetical protein
MEEKNEVEQIAKIFLFEQRIRHLAKTYSKTKSIIINNKREENLKQ